MLACCRRPGGGAAAVAFPRPGGRRPSMLQAGVKPMPVAQPTLDLGPTPQPSPPVQVHPSPQPAARTQAPAYRPVMAPAPMPSPPARAQVVPPAANSRTRRPTMLQAAAAGRMGQDEAEAPIPTSSYSSSSPVQSAYPDTGLPYGRKRWPPPLGSGYDAFLAWASDDCWPFEDDIDLAISLMGGILPHPGDPELDVSLSESNASPAPNFR